MAVKSKPGDKHRRNTGGNLLPPWEPGQSGNPKGRPPNIFYLSEILRSEINNPCPPLLRKKLSAIMPEGEVLTIGQAVVAATLMNMMKGNGTAINTIWDRLEGKVPLPITGSDGGPLQVDVDVRGLLAERLKRLKA